MPSDWKSALGSLAKFFNFQPSELMEMDAGDIYFWVDRMKEQVKLERDANK